MRDAGIGAPRVDVATEQEQLGVRVPPISSAAARVRGLTPRAVVRRLTTGVTAGRCFLMLVCMTASGAADGKLLGISDLHVTHPENRVIVEHLRPESHADWLIVCGDVSDAIEDVVWALSLLSERFACVVWVPGNHELWTMPDAEEKLRGEERYRHLVEACRRIGVVTPEDPYPVWEGEGGPATVAPLFLLYDYTFGLRSHPPRRRRSRVRTTLEWCAVTSSCCMPIHIPAGKRGVTPEWARRSVGSPPATATFQPC